MKTRAKPSRSRQLATTRATERAPAPSPRKFQPNPEKKRHADLALEFYEALVGDRDVSDVGEDLETGKVDAFLIAHDLLPLADVDRDDPRFRARQNARDRSRHKINSGAHCMTLPINRRYEITTSSGYWRIVPLHGRVQRGLKELASATHHKCELVMKPLSQKIKECELLAGNDYERRLYEESFAQVALCMNMVDVCIRSVRERADLALRRLTQSA
jgi:hypothetical protein